MTQMRRMITTKVVAMCLIPRHTKRQLTTKIMMLSNKQDVEEDPEDAFAFELLKDRKMSMASTNSQLKHLMAILKMK